LPAAQARLGWTIGLLAAPGSALGGGRRSAAKGVIENNCFAASPAWAPSYLSPDRVHELPIFCGNASVQTCSLPVRGGRSHILSYDAVATRLSLCLNTKPLIDWSPFPASGIPNGVKRFRGLALARIKLKPTID
jgi:hypothetical protein